MAVANGGAMIAKGPGVTQPQRYPVLPGGQCSGALKMAGLQGCFL